MIIAYGGGANGKSTFWNTIFRVLGDYAGKLSAEALTMNCKRNIKPEMAELKGRRLIISSEMEEGMRLNTATVKQLCSTDEIQAEKKYKAPFDLLVECKSNFGSTPSAPNSARLTSVFPRQTRNSKFN